MIDSIRKSNAFQSDVQRYTNIISQLPDGQDKVEMNKLLSTLIHEVKKMDDLHEEFIYNKQMSSLGTEFRDKIQNIRRQLETKAKEAQILLKASQ
jgi:hypothetical protein